MIDNIEILLHKIQLAAFEVRRRLKPGYLEKVYHNALMIELELLGLKAESEVYIPVIYRDRIIGNYKADILVENKVILEIKAVNEILKIHEAQLVNYLVATGVDYGVLINYGGTDYRFCRKTRLYNPSH